MSGEQKVTGNMKAPNKELEILKSNFPHCFDKEGKFQFDKLRNLLLDKEVNFSAESYGIDWLGKSYARLIACDPATTLLKEDDAHNAMPENANSENLLIKGDNLEVLKHLVNAYYEKVKMIYIDPPYNTGGDGFVYEDDRKFTVEELVNLTGIDKERAKRILDFTKQKSNSHSAWLTFMYPRLYVARQLLKEDGVIFISIDDNEVAQLRLLMDEIFGEENIVAELPTIMNLKGNNDEFGFAGTHEYTIVYSKNKNYTLLNQLSVNDDELEEWVEDDEGSYKQGANLKATGTNAPREKRPNLYFPIFIDSEDKVYVTDDNNPPEKYSGVLTTLLPITNGQEMSWRWSKDKVRSEPNNIIVSRNGNIGIYKKQRPSLGELPSKKPKTLFYKAEYSSGNGTAQIKSLFGDKYFPNPKPNELIKDFIAIGTSSNDIVLDFFAGSGTTADAVMQLNAEDGGRRKYILVQLPEQIDSKKSKPAYDFVTNVLKAEPTIFEITKERLIRAAAKIKREKPHYQGDLGFKIIETIPIWEDYNFEAEEFSPEQSLFDIDKLTTADVHALLTTWKTYDGIALTQELQKIALDNYTGYYGKSKLYLMNKGFTTEHLKLLLEKIDSDKAFNPTTIISFGHHFDSKNLRELSENVKSYSNKKNIDIDFIIRY